MLNINDLKVGYKVQIAQERIDVFGESWRYLIDGTVKSIDFEQATFCIEESFELYNAEDIEEIVD